MRTIVTGFVVLVLVARAATACGSSDDDDAGQDATNDTTTSRDAPTDTTSDVKAAADASDGSDANAGDSSDASGVDVIDASLGMDATDAHADAITDAVAPEGGGSCIDGGVVCTISEPCCMNFASVNYGKCELMTSCK
jgi:hypothetical protein